MEGRLIFLFLFISGHIFGQAVEERSWKTRSHTLAYAMYTPKSERVDRVVIALHDASDPSWQHVTWCHELSWLADSLNAIVLSPAYEKSIEFDQTTRKEWLRSIQDSLLTKPLEFVTLGNGISKAAPMIRDGVPGIIIAPTDSLPNFEHLNGVWGVVNSQPGDSSGHVAQRLAKGGAWTFDVMVIGEAPYYFTHHKAVVYELHHKVDSVQALLNDTTGRVSFTSKLLNKVPEVLRQGKPLVVEVFVAHQGEYEFALLDLTAKEVFQRKTFLSKGTHRIEIPTSTLEWGVYKLEVDGPKLLVKQKFMVRG